MLWGPLDVRAVHVQDHYATNRAALRAVEVVVAQNHDETNRAVVRAVEVVVARGDCTNSVVVARGVEQALVGNRGVEQALAGDKHQTVRSSPVLFLDFFAAILKARSNCHKTQPQKRYK